MLYKTQYSSPIGQLLIVSDEKALIGLWFEGQKYFLGTIYEEIKQDDQQPILIQTKKWLDQYFDLQYPLITDLPLAPRGTEFQQAIWKILCQIPYGEVTTYAKIASQVADIYHKPRMSAQAVGGAVGHNPISIIIPCHRVVGSQGSLTGYAGGIDKKIQLLEHEGVDVTKYCVPKKGKAL